LETWQSLFAKLWDEKDRKGTKRDEEGTSLDFVPVPHSNLGPCSGKIPARNDPHIQHVPCRTGFVNLVLKYLYHIILVRFCLVLISIVFQYCRWQRIFDFPEWFRNMFRNTWGTRHVPCSLLPVPCSLKDSPPPKKKFAASKFSLRWVVSLRSTTCSLFPVPVVLTGKPIAEILINSGILNTFPWELRWSVICFFLARNICTTSFSHPILVHRNRPLSLYMVCLYY